MRPGLIAALLLALTSTTAAAQTISGPATVTDGDTIRVGDTRIRIAGIDAPEKTQTCESRDGRVYECGRDAAAVMAELIRNRTVTCTPTGHSYNRIVATCSTESGDLGEQMVRRGWSVRVPRYDRECRYCAAEAEAKAAGRGIWAGRFEMPADFRRVR